MVFLSFNGAFDDGVTISPIRLNTLFAKELINKANVSIDDLLAWDTQLTLEPAMTSGASPTPMDFYGANGLYFWELFFYMPWLVASRLSQEGNYADAQKWFNYIFDPSACGRANSNADYPEPDYWSVRPLVEANAQESLAALILNPDDPDMIAKADPVHYQKAIAMAYLANLIAAGDADYRLLTNGWTCPGQTALCTSQNAAWSPPGYLDAPAMAARYAGKYRQPAQYRPHRAGR
nr:Uncharacterised protein [Salmonella sp. NCTC 7297]